MPPFINSLPRGIAVLHELLYQKAMPPFMSSLPGGIAVLHELLEVRVSDEFASVDSWLNSTQTS